MIQKRSGSYDLQEDSGRRRGAVSHRRVDIPQSAAAGRSALPHRPRDASGQASSYGRGLHSPYEIHRHRQRANEIGVFRAVHHAMVHRQGNTGQLKNRRTTVGFLCIGSFVEKLLVIPLNTIRHTANALDFR